MRNRIFLTTACGMLLAGCGEVDCPDGAEYDGRRCVLVDAGSDAATDRDAGPDASTDGGASSDAGETDGAAPDGCVASAETCNATDDDCDGLIDEGTALTVAGSPEPVTTGGTAHEDVVLFELPDGYFAAWDSADRDIQYAWLDEAGSVIDGPSLVDGTATPFQTSLSGAIVGDSAVLTWTENSVVRARAIPLDGSSAPAPLTISTETGTSLIGTATAAVSGGVIIGWRRDDVGIATATYNGALLAEIEPPDLSYSFETAPSSTFPPVLVPSSTDSEYVLLGLADQRGSDSGPRAYVGRMAATGLAEGTFTGMGPALQAPSVYGAVLASAGSGITAAIVGVSRSGPGGTQRIDLHALNPGDFGDPMMVSSTPIASDRFFATAAIAGDAEAIDVAWAEVAGASAQVKHVTVLDDGTVTEPDAIGSTVGPSVAMVRRPMGRGAVLYLDGAPGERDVMFQRLACE